MNTELKLKIIGLDCPDCAAKLEAKVAREPGVTRSFLDFSAGELRLSFDRNQTAEPELIKAIGRHGYRAVAGVRSAEAPVSDPQAVRAQRLRFWMLLVAVASLALQGVSVLLHLPQAVTIACAILALSAGGLFTYRSAFFALRNLSADMNLLMTIAVAGAAILGDWGEASVTIVLFALANYLEGRSVRKARSAFKRLAKDLPQTIELVTPDGPRLVELADLKPGDKIQLKPGMACPTDCEIIEGSAHINQASLTGEPAPVAMGAGDLILGGMINTDGALRLSVRKAFSDSTLARIMHMVEDAASRKATLATLVDRFARVYTPAVVGLAALAALVPPLLLGGEFHEWFYRALVFLVISCPCALVISTPVAVICSLTRAAREGILIKGGVFLEKLAGLRGVLFDKTGTLTEGKFMVTDLVAANGLTPQRVLSIAASIEANSEHPLAKAIADRARAEGLPLLPTTAFTAFPGRGARAFVDGREYSVGSHRFVHENGVDCEKLHRRADELEAEGKTVVLLSTDHRVAGAIAIADSLKPTSGIAISELKRMGISELVMLTGDNRRTAAAVAAQVGIANTSAELLPTEKKNLAEVYERKYGTVAMVGDGINDAPALAAASVGIAMGTGGSDLAIQAADVAIIGDNPLMIPRAIDLGRRTVAIIKFNILFAILTKVAFMVLAALGLATLWMAVAADMGTSLLVIFNSLRLLYNPSCLKPS